MLSSQEIRQRLLDSGLCKPEDVVGFSEAYVESMEKTAGVTFPAQYREFLLAAGMSARTLADGSIFTGEELIQLSQYLMDTLEHSEETWRPPEHFFVFFDHCGYQYTYFICDGAPDPSVYSYFDGKGPPILAAPSFSEFLLRLIAEDVAIRAKWKD